MNVLKLRYASEVKIQPAFVKGMEEHGLYFYTDYGSEALGGQCSVCHTIIWVFGRKHPILSENADSVPDSGPVYRAYYQDNLKRFLLSLPPCPSCGETKYDLFINNVACPRLADGTDISNYRRRANLIPVDPNSVQVWWLEN